MERKVIIFAVFLLSCVCAYSQATLLGQWYSKKGQSGGGGSLGISGGSVTTNGDYHIHTFTSSDTMIVTGDVLIDYLVIGGGGGGGASDSANCGAGGGGAGGVLRGTDYLISEGEYSVTVGAGGDGMLRADITYAAPALTGSGDDSSIGALFVALGGGGGGRGRANGTGFCGDGAAGGSGGGAGANYMEGQTVKGLGEAGPPRQGYDGAAAYAYAAGNGGGGGGGAGGAGQNYSGGYGYYGGAGINSSITRVSVGYAGGGSSGSTDGRYGRVSIGYGGGYGGGNNPRNGGPGTDGTGGGGGGGTRISTYGDGGDGGSGIVIVRWDTTQ